MKLKNIQMNDSTLSAIFICVIALAFIIDFYIRK